MRKIHIVVDDAWQIDLQVQPVGDTPPDATIPDEIAAIVVRILDPFIVTSINPAVVVEQVNG